MKRPLWQIAFLQALGVAFYISLVGLFFRNANSWFGPQDNFISPMLFLTLFSTSALVCGLLVFGCPFLLWSDKAPRKALRVVIYTAGWLALWGAGLFLALLAA